MLFTVLVALAPLNATAEVRYLDDRSNAASLIASLYNAVNRQEYARAWSYFDESARPDYESFVAGYGTTKSVELAVGEVSREGAAGSLYFRAPVAIRAAHTDGSSEVFAGCYTLRLAQPAIQEPPFQSLRIIEASLAAAAPVDRLAEAVPAGCPD